jgi:hypothetical protein
MGDDPDPNELDTVWHLACLIWRVRLTAMLATPYSMYYRQLLQLERYRKQAIQREHWYSEQETKRVPAVRDTTALSLQSIVKALSKKEGETV